MWLRLEKDKPTKTRCPECGNGTFSVYMHAALRAVLSSQMDLSATAPDVRYSPHYGTDVVFVFPSQFTPCATVARRRSTTTRRRASQVQPLRIDFARRAHAFSFRLGTHPLPALDAFTGSALTRTARDGQTTITSQCFACSVGWKSSSCFCCFRRRAAAVPSARAGVAMHLFEVCLALRLPAVGLVCFRFSLPVWGLGPAAS